MLSLVPVVQQHVGTQVYERLEQAIVDCSIEPGALLSDRHLGDLLGVSRTPVRDALRQLEFSGLVERRGRAGWAVCGIDVGDVQEVFELRRLLEPAGLQKVVAWDEDRLTRLTTTFDGFPVPLSKEDIARYLAVDDSFHRTIVHAAGNRRLSAAYAVVERQLDRFRHFTSYRYEGRVDQSMSEHRAVCKALAQRDADAAAHALVQHLSSAEEKLIFIVRSHSAPSVEDEPKQEELE